MQKLIKMEEILLFRKEMVTYFFFFFLKRRVTLTCGYLNSSVFFEDSNEEIGTNFN